MHYLAWRHLPPKAQEEAATYIEALVEALRHTSGVYTHKREGFI